MELSLDIGTINIQNQEVAKFIENKSIEELRNMITDFLNNQVKIISNNPTTKKGKWAKVADEIRDTMSYSTVNYLKECSQEVRSGFELRDFK